MRINLDGEQLIISDEKPSATGRRCGACTLCCKLVSVKALGKPGGAVCPHQSFARGCKIYATRPRECAEWSCRWLAEPAETAGMPRPDRAHYVIDQMPDRVVAVNNDGSLVDKVVVQVLLDPAFPAARHDPALRRYMEHMAEPPRSMATKLIFGHDQMLIVVPPVLSVDGAWFETPVIPARVPGLLGERRD